MVAFLIVAFSLASFSNCTAIREKAISRLPEFSPASTMLISIGGKISACPLMESARVFPFSTLRSTSEIARFSHFFSVCSESICRASFMGTPACVILTNCRQNTLRSLGFTFLPMEKSISLFNAPCSLIETGINPSFFRISTTFSLESASIFPLFSFPFLSIAT